MLGQPYAFSQNGYGATMNPRKAHPGPGGHFKVGVAGGAGAGGFGKVIGARRGGGRLEA